MSFKIGDNIIHPLHGAGTISATETRRVDGANKEFYVVKLPDNGMVVMIPVDSCEKIGVRALSTVEEIDAVLNDIPTLQIDSAENWNKRYRENMFRIKSGDIREVAAVIKGLMLRDEERGLSTGERKMLSSSKQILLSEISMVKKCSFETAEKELYYHIFMKSEEGK